LPVDIVHVHEAQARFVDQRGRLKRIAAALAAPVTVGAPAQLIVDDGRKLCESAGIPIAPRPQHTRELPRWRPVHFLYFVKNIRRVVVSSPVSRLSG
jgi:hypothetical protein